MKTLIILIILIGIGIYLIITRNEFFDYKEALGIIICVTFGVLLLIHLSAWSLKGRDYKLFVEKRNAFENTLKEARKNSNEYEIAAIVKYIAKWNIQLAAIQYDNKNWFLNQYIDNRFDELKPIK